MIDGLELDGIEAEHNCLRMKSVIYHAPVAALSCGSADLQSEQLPSSPVMGEPHFVGLLGQLYNVPGLRGDGEVYNLISDAVLQLNARFTFLSSGRCDTDVVTGEPLYACWTRPGMYLTAIGLRTAAGDTVEVHAGEASRGFDSLIENVHRVAITPGGEEMEWPVPMTHLSADDSLPPLTIQRIDNRTLIIANAGLYTLTLHNSDSFVTLQVELLSMSRLVRRERSHGLIGQTWLLRTDGLEAASIEGRVDEYREQRDELLGRTFVFNRFPSPLNSDE